MLHIPVSVGELLDKITILEIKSQRIEDETKCKNVEQELSALQSVRRQAQLYSPPLEEIVQALKKINEVLWDIEDKIRFKEAQQSFDQEFIELARSVYQTNDERALLKRKINELTGSKLIEEKSYQDYSL
ncbi:MAG: DUF6165 family protein [Pseudomonadota bacterium]